MYFKYKLTCNNKNITDSSRILVLCCCSQKIPENGCCLATVITSNWLIRSSRVNYGWIAVTVYYLVIFFLKFYSCYAVPERGKTLWYLLEIQNSTSVLSKNVINLTNPYYWIANLTCTINQRLSSTVCGFGYQKKLRKSRRKMN